MSWDRRLDLHIDVDAPSTRNLLVSETDSSVLNSPPELVAGDKIIVRIHFWRRGSVAGSIESIDPGADATFRLSARPLNVPADTDLLFLATSFSEVGTGIWETTLDCATQELADHLATAPAGAKTITAELEVRDSGDTGRRSIQFTAIARPQVWDNQDAPTILPTPVEWLLGSSAPTNQTAAVARDSARYWNCSASSADGTKLVAVVIGGQIYTSTDSGATWTARDSSRSWWGVASSADGTKLVATVNGGQIYTSTDSGATWTARDSSRSWRFVASSADGTKLVATVEGGQIYTSTDSGAAWTARETNQNWIGVASSADGTKLVAVVTGGEIYTSTDSGVTWTGRESERSWMFAASSADGAKLVATGQGLRIYTSTDSGATWTARDSTRQWTTLASSSDGVNLVAAEDSGKIYTSTDSGATWTARETDRAWNGASSSADGTKLVVCAYMGQIYTISNALAVTTAAPPYLRVAGGFLYIQESGTWKKSALSAL